MRIHCLQHVPFEGPAAIADWAAKRGHSLVISRLYAGEALPSLDVFDWLLIMGGPMNIYQELQHPWLAAEKACIDQALAADKTLLGICLGAQLIVRALGARVYPGHQKEIGWSPIQLDEAGSRSALRHFVGDGVCVLHWHGETFDLPEDAEHLASSELYPNQAFSYGKSLALQFHPEVTARGLEQWFIGHTGEIHQTEGISVNQLRDDTSQFTDTLQARAYLFLMEWLEQVSAD